MISHIMVPYDQSDPANRALDHAIDLAKKYGSKISIVSVIVPQSPMDPTFATAYGETLILMRNAASESLAKLESRLKDMGIACKTDVLEGLSITDKLISYSDSHKVDLIVMGSRGLGGFKKLLLGSVASGVIQHSTCPVLIIK
ncbi:MAG TPA: universal stress protein [Candidatus Nitrosotalea sp.]|nr:universal stress protein [Candidatus Nitrosotalea sp.]